MRRTIPELAASSQRRARQMKHGGSPTCQRPSYPRLRTSADPIRVARGKTGGTLDSVLCCECASPVRAERNAPSPSVSATAVPVTPVPPNRPLLASIPTRPQLRTTTHSPYERCFVHNSRPHARAPLHLTAPRPPAVRAAPDSNLALSRANQCAHYAGTRPAHGDHPRDGRCR